MFFWILINEYVGCGSVVEDFWMSKLIIEFNVLVGEKKVKYFVVKVICFLFLYFIIIIIVVNCNECKWI